MRKKILSFFLIQLLLVFSNSLLFPEYNVRTIDGNLNATESPDHILLTWSDDPSTTQTITWRARTTVTRASVKYRESNGLSKDYIVKKAELEKFTAAPGDKKGSMNIFSVVLTGLKPGTGYTYSIVCGNNSSACHTFTTASENADDFSFIIFGDSQSGNANFPNYKLWHNTVFNAYKNIKDARFIMNVGDLVEIGQKYTHWNNWFEAAKDVVSSIPAMAVPGNHENYALPAWGVSDAVYLTRQFKLFQNGPEGFKGRVYSFDYGNAHITVLDSQQKEQYKIHGDILKAQTEWLEKDLAASALPWKLVFFHKPPYSNYLFRANDDIKEAFCPVFDKYHVDVVFNAHDHVFARTYPVRNDKVYREPSEGTVYYIVGRSGDKRHSLEFSNEWNAFFYNPKDQPCYLAVTVGKSRLKITAIKMDGSIIDSYAIDKR